MLPMTSPCRAPSRSNKAPAVLLSPQIKAYNLEDSTSQRRFFGAWSIINPTKKSLRKSGVAVTPRRCKPLQLQSSLMQYHPLCGTLRHFSGLLERVFTLHKASASGDGAITGPQLEELANRSTQSKTCKWLTRSEEILICRL